MWTCRVGHNSSGKTEWHLLHQLLCIKCICTWLGEIDPRGQRCQFHQTVFAKQKWSSAQHLEKQMSFSFFIMLSLKIMALTGHKYMIFLFTRKKCSFLQIVYSSPKILFSKPEYPSFPTWSQSYQTFFLC